MKNFLSFKTKLRLRGPAELYIWNEGGGKNQLLLRLMTNIFHVFVFSQRYALNFRNDFSGAN